jgi:hypothetical protein
MAELDVSGAFIITIGHGSGPEVEVAISANYEDGKPYDFPRELEKMPVSIFVALSPMWGGWFLPLKIVKVIDQAHSVPGFCAVRVENEWSDIPPLDQVKPATLGIVVDDGADRGQCLACSCGPAEVSTWWSDKVREPSRK